MVISCICLMSPLAQRHFCVLDLCVKTISYQNSFEGSNSCIEYYGGRAAAVEKTKAKEIDK